jgi:hypothetical protein
MQKSQLLKWVPVAWVPVAKIREEECMILVACVPVAITSRFLWPGFLVAVHFL